MPKIVLLPVDGSSAGERVFAAALAMGKGFDAHFVALHVRPDIKRDIAAMAAGDGGMAAGLDTLIDRMETDADAREKTAFASWQAFCAANSIVAADQP